MTFKGEDLGDQVGHPETSVLGEDLFVVIDHLAQVLGNFGVVCF